MANVKYNSFGQAVAQNDMSAVTIGLMFCDPAYTPDPDTEVFLADISANRASGSTDITGTLTIAVDNATDRTTFDFPDLVATGTFTTNAVAVYISTGNEATAELLCYLDLLNSGTPDTFNVIAGTLAATVNTAGLFTL